MALDEALDSSARMEALKKELTATGTLTPEGVQFLFSYVEALELALDFSAGAGPTEAEAAEANEHEHSFVTNYIAGEFFGELPAPDER